MCVCAWCPRASFVLCVCVCVTAGAAILGSVSGFVTRLAGRGYDRKLDAMEEEVRARKAASSAAK